MTTDKDGFLKLRYVPGGRMDRFRRKRQFKEAKIPKDPNEFIDSFVDNYGVGKVMNMDTINIGDYVYDRGLNHSLNVNVGRNIPWIEDGLKSVERRALYIMYRAKLYHGKFDKVAGVTGDMLKYVHPHGDQSAADTIYRLGRKRTMMIPYIAASGNFGNMEDMRPASPRYASASLSQYAMDCFFSEMGAKYPIFDVKDNYKYSDKEPVFLTSRYPNILMQWNLGIGKGAQAYLGAFNSKDIFKTALKMLDNPNCKVDIYPDTPVPLDIVNKKDLKGCFDKPRFKVEMRAKYEIVNDKKKDDHGRVVDKYTIVFTSLPITVTGQQIKNEIIKKKEEDAKKGANKLLPEVINLEVSVSDKTPGGIRFIVEYERGYDPQALVEKLFRMTSLAKTIGVKYLLITDNKPELYSPRQVMQTWIAQRYDQKRRYYHQLVLKAAKDRSRLEAICIVLETSKNIDKTIDIIKKSKTTDDAVKGLMKEFNFSEFQANCIVQLRLSNLPKMSIEDTKAERDKALEDYKHYRKLLSSESAIKEAIKEELEDGLRKYGRDRMADLTNKQAATVGDPDEIKQIFYNNEIYWFGDSTKLKKHLDKETRISEKFMNKEQILIISKTGLIKILDGHAFKETEAGISFNQLGIPDAIAVIPLKAWVQKVYLVTEQGIGKVMEIGDILKSTKSKIINLGEGDKLAAAIPTSDGYNGVIGLATENAKAYFTNTEDYPLLKRTAQGNRMVKLSGDRILRAFSIHNDTAYVILCSEFGNTKAINIGGLKFNKRKPPVVDMKGKTIMNIFGLKVDTTEFTLYGGDKPVVYNTIMFNKNDIQFVARDDIKNKIKFKLSTSVGDPTKTLKFGRNEYYEFKETR